MFPGQGSQTVGMGCDLAAADPVMRRTFVEASVELGYDVEAMCAHASAADLARTDRTQPALLAVSVGIWRLLHREGLRFDAAIGHSLGDYSALVATGGCDFRAALRVVRRRGEEMLAAAERAHRQHGGRDRPGRRCRRPRCAQRSTACGRRTTTHLDRWW